VIVERLDDALQSYLGRQRRDAGLRRAGTTTRARLGGVTGSQGA
jgi:hypothetical protein